MKFDNQLRYCVRMLAEYNPGMPLPLWLKEYYRNNRQMGSRDRKTVSELIFTYFRLGHAALGIQVADRVLAGLFLCNNQPNEILAYFKPEWNEKIGWRTEDKMSFCQAAGLNLHMQDIFPWSSRLSDGVEPLLFAKSFLLQPDLFIRIRPGKKEWVLSKLESAAIPHEYIEPSAVRLPNGTRIEKLFIADKEISIQDLNSQRTLSGLEMLMDGSSGNTLSVWDCCSGSGGKSILLHDLFPKIDLTVSDKRNSILINLQQRFRTADISNYHSFEADLTKAEDISLTGKQYDLILADLPCTGSGTWSRSPDSLFYFKEELIEHYALRQKKIIDHILPSLKRGGLLAYITCSVFKEENENQVAALPGSFGMQLEYSTLLRGYEQRADSLFVAILRKK